MYGNAINGAMAATNHHFDCTCACMLISAKAVSRSAPVLAWNCFTCASSADACQLAARFSRPGMKPIIVAIREIISGPADDRRGVCLFPQRLNADQLLRRL